MLTRFAFSALLCLAALPSFAENWSIGGAIGPFVFGQFAERTVVINTETGTGKTTSRLSAATRPGAAADIERDFNDWLAVRLEAAWTQSKLRLKSSGGGTGVTIDSGRVNVTTFVVPFVVRLNRGSIRFHLMGGPAYALYNMRLQTGYHPQFARNNLQLNRGAGRFSEIGLLAGVAATDWSWAPLFADLDNDGQKDLFITNGVYRRPNDMDYITYVGQEAIAAGVFAYLVKPFKETDLVPALRAAVARHAELLTARRAVGEKPLRPVVISVRSPSGNEWPIRVQRTEDGELEVQVVDEREARP